MNFDGMTPRDAAKAILRDHFDSPAITTAAQREGSWVAQYTHLTEALEKQITTACQHFSNEALERGRRFNHQALVAEFHRAMGVRIQEKPGFPPQDRMDLRVRLIAEEFCEFLESCGYPFELHIAEKGMWESPKEAIFYKDAWDRHEQHFAKAADALIDLEYVILGTHLEFGVESQPLFEEVHAANMRKVGGPVVNGKITKPEGWTGPDIEIRLREQGWKSD